MTLFVLVVILILATGCRALKWHGISKTLYALSIMLFLAIGCGPIPAWLLGSLQSAYSTEPTLKWGNRNAIVLLGAGTQKIPGPDLIEPGMFSYGRIIKAAQLYNDCQKTAVECKIIVSGGDAKHNGLPEAVVYQNSLLKLKVDSDDLIVESKSMNTWQNAQFTKPILERYNPNEVMLVSSGFHLARSVLYFTHFGILTIPIRADYLGAIPSILPLSYNFALTDFALHEYIGIIRYSVYNALGWNSAKT